MYLWCWRSEVAGSYCHQEQNSTSSGGSGVPGDYTPGVRGVLEREGNASCAAQDPRRRRRCSTVLKSSSHIPMRVTTFDNKSTSEDCNKENIN